MFDLRPVLHVFALCLFAEGLFLLLPALLELGANEDEAAVFLASAAIAAFVGGALALTTRQHRMALSLRQTFLLTPLCWFGLPVFGALPFMFGETDLSFTDAYFETVSGFTTTGSTVIAGLDGLGPGIHLWRGLLLALGAVGFIVIALAVLPFLRIGGMQIMRTESSDRSEKVLPRASQIATVTAATYAVLVSISAVALWFCGMTPLEALVHAMSATATGGFSTSDLSIGNFDAAAHWVATCSMLMGALPFALLYRTWRGEYRALPSDSQVRAFFLFLLAVIVPLGFWLWLEGIYPGLEEALRHSALNVVSIVTTTGFASADYQLWGAGVLPVFLFLMLVGGCTGSTTGAIKIFRWQILFGLARRQLVRAVYPNRVLAERYNGKPLPPDVPSSVGLFLFLYLGLIMLITVALAATGLDFTTALSSAVSAIGNIGPGLGPLVGPAGNFVPLSDTATWLLSIAMVMGRLELLTVLVLLDPRFWRR